MPKIGTFQLGLHNEVAVGIVVEGDLIALRIRDGVRTIGGVIAGLGAIAAIIGDSDHLGIIAVERKRAGKTIVEGSLRLRIKEGEWNEAVKLIELELIKEPKDFEGLRLLAEACVQLKMFDKAQAQMETILNNPDATSDQKAWAKSEQARIGDCQRTAATRVTRPGRFVSA